MLSLLFGATIFFGGVVAIIFIDAFWGLVASSCFVHIAPLQVHIHMFRVVLVLSLLTIVTYSFGNKYSNKFAFRPAEFWLMVLMLLGMALSSVNAYDKAATWDKVFTFAKMILFFLLLVNIIDNRRKLYWWINGLLLSAAWMVYRCWDLRGTTGARFENVDGGIIGDSNQFAAALLLMLPLSIARAMQKDEKPWIRICAVSGAFGIIMSIIITVSRGAFLGLIALALSYPFFFKSYRKRILTILIVLSIAIAPFIPTYYIERTAMIFSDKAIESDESAKSRFTSWELSFELFKEHPLVGIGMHNFGYYMGHRHEGRQWGVRGHVAHSIWMQALAEGGGMVFVPFVSMLIFFYLRIEKAKKLAINEKDSIEICSLQAGFVSFLVAATFVNRLFYEPIYWWCGMASIYLRLAEINNKETIFSIATKGKTT